MTDSNSHVSRRAYLKGVGVGGAAGMSSLSGCTAFGGGGSSDTITIAGTVPLTGSFSSIGQDMERGYELGVQRMNENLDQEVELVLADDESDADRLRNQLNQAVSNNDVDMLWGSFSSLLVTAGSAFAENQGIPFLGVAFAYMQPHLDRGYEWTFAPFPKSRDVARSTAGLLELIPEEERPSTIGIWEPNSGWGQEQADYWEEELSGDYDIALREKFSIGSQDFSTLISQSKSAGVEALLSNPTPGGGITAMKQMQSNDFAPKLLKFVRGADPSAWWSALGQNGAFATMCPGWVPGLTGNGNSTLDESYRSEYDIGDDQLLPVQVGTSYNLTQVAEQTLANAESTEPDAVREVLRSREFNTVIGDFSFENNGLPREGQLTAPVGQWWEGGQHTVYPDVDGDAAIDFKYPLTPWGER
ncbi:ABC transporter substrate-binding protein [Halobium palmae]|uniref:ABC transporter substrate-binding protein n=1 Tax=Halobium palmae TaxID=1776492 RepID=A0ABD5RZS1_9EURY